LAGTSTALSAWPRPTSSGRISLPVAGPVDANWAELRPALRDAWIDTTRCANWMLTEFYKGDVRRAPQDTKLGPMPRTYLYPEGRARFPNLPAQTVAHLENQTRRLYSAQRYELLWLGARSLATMRYPTPCRFPRRAGRSSDRRAGPGTSRSSLANAGGGSASEGGRNSVVKPRS